MRAIRLQSRMRGARKGKAGTDLVRARTALLKAMRSNALSRSPEARPDPVDEASTCAWEHRQGSRCMMGCGGGGCQRRTRRGPRWRTAPRKRAEETWRGRTAPRERAEEISQESNGVNVPSFLG